MTEGRERSIHERLAVIETKLDNVLSKYITKEEFKPVKNIVYGLVGIILVAFATGLIALIVS